MKHSINNFAIHITNVCNLNCPDCQKFNNFKFNGHYLWKDYKDVFKKWSQRLEPELIAITGGETLLNPSLYEWIKGIREYWPDTPMQVLSNGTQLHLHNKLYDILLSNNVKLNITQHNLDCRELLFDKVQDFLEPPILEEMKYNEPAYNIFYNNVKDETWPECNTTLEFYDLPKHIQEECKNAHGFDFDQFRKWLKLVDKNNVKMTFTRGTEFWESMLYYKDNKLQVHDSDPEIAWDNCPYQICYHMTGAGKLCKCPPLAGINDFDEQFNVLSRDQKELLSTYKFLTPEQTDDEFDDFIDRHLTSSHSICKFCPESVIMKKRMYADIGKIKVA